jgi:prepilin-type N-terminal cleavage/methylation domain-containing protein
MIRRRADRRAGYTLLEVLLASVIAVIVLGALYVTLDVTLLRMDVGRDQVTANNLSRAVVNRMTTDLGGVLGPLPPRSGGGVVSSDPAAATFSQPPATGSSGSSGSTGTTPPAEGSIEGDTTSPDAQAILAADVPFQAGMIGSDTILTVFTSRVPEALSSPEVAFDPTLLLPADLRRVTYYMSPSGAGLCRQERPWVTADGVRNSIDPDYSTEALDLIAPEVQDVLFEYYDGGAWLPFWDGSELAIDGKSVAGPPRAVRATFVLVFPGQGGEVVVRQVQHVFPIRAAVGGYLPPLTGTEPTQPDTGTVPPGGGM